jgi:putative transposase
MMQYSKNEYGNSTGQALKIFSIQPSVYYYKPTPSDDQQIMNELGTMASIHNRWGFWMMNSCLRNLNFQWNYKKVNRIYRSMGLNLR